MVFALKIYNTEFRFQKQSATNMVYIENFKETQSSLNGMEKLKIELLLEFHRIRANE